MAKTLVDLDRDLLTRAQTVLGAATIKDAVHEALRRVVAEQAVDELADYFGSLDVEQERALATVRDSGW